MPRMPILGGVLKHGAWGREFSRQRSMRGALFIGGEAVDSGAVGCIMSGSIQASHLFTPVRLNTPKSSIFESGTSPGRTGRAVL